MIVRSYYSGFTLIELLVVISIIGLLSSIVLASLNSARMKANDSARISDVKALKSAVEMYYNDTHMYPQYGVADTAQFVKRLTILVPTYLTSMPHVFKDDADQYVWSGTDSYGLYIYTEASHAYCKMGVNMNPLWWNGSPDCTF